MRFFSKLFGLDMQPEPPQTFITRDGLLRPSDKVFDAWTAGDLGRLLAALETPTHPVDRHHLLQSIVELTYKDRNKSGKMRELCESISRLHLKEFPTLAIALRKEFKGYGADFLPRVTTFQHLATLLTEDGKYDEAVAICKMALSYNLHDRTAGGFESRIDRIRKKELKARM
jgi:hypothetical protein